MKLYLTLDFRWMTMVFNATSNNISVVSWLLICWSEELRVIRVTDTVNCKINRLKIVIYNLYGMKISSIEAPSTYYLWGSNGEQLEVITCACTTGSCITGTGSREPEMKGR